MPAGAGAGLWEIPWTCRQSGERSRHQRVDLRLAHDDGQRFGIAEKPLDPVEHHGAVGHLNGGIVQPTQLGDHLARTNETFRFDI